MESRRKLSFQEIGRAFDATERGLKLGDFLGSRGEFLLFSKNSFLEPFRAHGLKEAIRDWLFLLNCSTFFSFN